VNVLAQSQAAVADRPQLAPAIPKWPPAAGSAREPTPAAPRRLRNPLPHEPRAPPPAWDANRIGKLRLQLTDLESELGSSAGLRHVLQQLSNAEFTSLPLPGHGQTLTRWRALSEVAAHDLSLAQLFEAHADAIAIHAELDGFALPLRGIWGVWTAEAPRARVVVDEASDETGDDVTISGRKARCSGADIVTHALVTALDRDGRSRLVAIRLAQPGVLITLEGWYGVGMQAARSVDVVFDRAVAVAVGEPDGYGTRPGFWHQRGGIAACWYGAAAKLAETLRDDVARQHEPHAAAHLGALDAALAQAKALLREAAEAIDCDPTSSAKTQVLEVRAAAEFAADAALLHAGRALGVDSYSRNGSFARLAADLPGFLRQSRAERDLESLGRTIAQDREARWDL
jgi:hypothetical protein